MGFQGWRALPSKIAWCKIPNRFELVLLAGQRAREITAGSPLTVDRDDDKNPVVALREIAEETVGLDHLKDSLMRGMQKHVEMDEPEEAPELEETLFGVAEPIGAVIGEERSTGSDRRRTRGGQISLEDEEDVAMPRRPADLAEVAAGRARGSARGRG